VFLFRAMKANSVLYTSVIPVNFCSVKNAQSFWPFWPQHCASPVFLFRAMKPSEVLYTSVIPVMLQTPLSQGEVSPQHCVSPVPLFRVMNAP